MDEIQVEKMWQDFSGKYSVQMHKAGQQLLIFPDRKKLYSGIENINGLSIVYTYKFHSFDPIGGGSLLRIAIPVESNIRLLIYKPSLIRKLFLKEKITIKSSNSVILNPEILNNIVNLFKSHPDLKLCLGPSTILFGLIKPGECVLELITKYLPVTSQGLEQLREVLVRLSYLRNN